MRNPLTSKVESSMGAIFILALAMFFVGFIFIALKNFNSDLIVLNANEVQAKTISSTERELIKQWLKDNNIELPKGKGYHYIYEQYPSRPWLRY